MTTVLAIDDSRTTREIIGLTLRGAGIETRLAADGLHGLELLQEGTPDAIITDINMPRLDGFGFIEAARGREASRAVPILVLSTESAEGLKMRARAAGATGWIVKPFDPAKLIRAIRRVTG